MIERAHLAIIRQLGREGSLTAAARSLHLSQSALSHAIRRLEVQAGSQIWRREGRRVVLTPAGEHLRGAAERLLPQLDRLDDALSDFAAGDQGELRIGMECHPCYRWLLRVVEPFLDRWPCVDLDVIRQFQFGGMAALFQHEIDILVTPDPIARRGVTFTPVFDYEQVLVIAADHRFVDRSWVAAEDLAEETLLTYPVEPSRLDIFSELLRPAGVMPRRHKTLESTDIMLQMVAANRGVAALPRWLADEYRERLALATLGLGHHGIAKQIHLGVRHADEASRFISDFITQAGQARLR
ncbi:LysR family transcriptional regulator [uncultured Salinisphaera sp.]|uniref:LysR family transcriptional regulator n=1 Tax=uncultured Salinisphaera sp. TaxID=359372 RepID=UPI0032B1424D